MDDPADRSLIPTSLERIVLNEASSKYSAAVLSNNPALLLGKHIGAICDAITQARGVHSMALGIQLLSTATIFTGPEVKINPAPDAQWDVPVLLWSCLMAEPGAGKSPVIKANMQAALLAQYLINKFSPEVEDVVLISESKTQAHMYEAIQKSPCHTLGYIEDELTATLAGIGQFKTAAGSDAEMARFMEMYGGFRATDSSVSRGTLTIPYTHVPLTGAITPGKYRAYLSSKAASESGMEGRWIVAVIAAGVRSPSAVRELVAAASSNTATSDILERLLPPEQLASYAAAYDDMQQMTVRIPGEGTTAKPVRPSTALAAAPSRPSSSSSTAPAIPIPTAMKPLADLLQADVSRRITCADSDEYKAGRAAKRARSVADPVKILARVYVSLFFERHLPVLDKEKGVRRWQPDSRALVLSEKPEQVEGFGEISAYEIFDRFVLLEKRILNRVRDRELHDRNGIASKLSGNALRVIGIIKEIDDRLAVLTGTDDSSLTDACSAAQTVRGLDIVRNSTLQRFLQDDDTESIMVFQEMWPHLLIMGAAAPSFGPSCTVDEGAAAAAAAAAAQPRAQWWPLLVKAVLSFDKCSTAASLEWMARAMNAAYPGAAAAAAAPTVPGSSSGAATVAAAAGDTDDAAAAAAAAAPVASIYDTYARLDLLGPNAVRFRATDFVKSGKQYINKPSGSFSPEQYPFSMCKSAITAAKLLVNRADVKPAGDMIKALGGPSQAALYVLRVAAGEAAAVKQLLEEKHGSDEAVLQFLHLDELDSGALPAIGQLENSLGHDLCFLRKTLPVQNAGDPMAEFREYKSLAAALMQYGITLSDWHFASQRRFSELQHMVKEMQDAADRRMLQLGSDCLVDDMLSEQQGGGLGAGSGELPGSAQQANVTVRNRPVARRSVASTVGGAAAHTEAAAAAVGAGSGAPVGAAGREGLTGIPDEAA